MQPQDIVNVVLSGLALFASIGALVIAIYAYFAAKYQQATTLLDQLNAVLKDINALKVDMDKLRFEYSSKNEESQEFFFEFLYPELEQQLGSLLSQAMFLADQGLTKGNVSPVQLNTIAITNANLNQLTKARDYYELAISACKDNDSKAHTMQSYAGWLISQQDYDGGRKLYNDAIDLIKGDNDADHELKGIIYVSWARAEKYGAENPEEVKAQVESLYKKAYDAFGQIKTFYLRDANQRGLMNEIRKHPSASTSTIQPVLVDPTILPDSIKPDLQTH